MKLRSFLGPALLVAASTSIAVGGVEVALRLLDKFPPPPAQLESRRPDLYRTDPDVGYKMWPGVDTTYRYPPDAADLIPLKSNSQGFRQPRDFGEADERTRVLLLGDSFVFGEGVRAEVRVGEVLESLEPLWRVDNLGMPGWGLDLMVRALEHYGPVIRPNVVVLCFYTDDFRRLHPYYAGAGFYYSKFELVDGRLQLKPRTAPGFFESTRLWQAWMKRYWASRANRYPLNEALLDRFLAQSVELGFAPVTVFLPGRGDNDQDKERRGFLRAWSEENSVPFLDLTEPIHSAGVENAYIQKNWHWNELGHRIAAEQIHALLTSGAVDFRH
ncbi:MAG TPA: SGNH/GDSL hydrolase family protein [Longimicrobiales bacterium]|nr:SGNH/GDSL hydrolase family protein [Longimicrobiales bacterium]